MLGELLGRQAESETVLSLLRAGVPVAVTGPAGIGKTALCLAVAERFGSAAVGGALGSLRWLPYLPLSRAVGQLPADADPETIAATVARRLRGSMLFVDDLHDADPLTLRALASLPASVPLVVAMREAETTGTVRATIEEIGARFLKLAPLDDEACRALVHRLAPRLPPGEVDRIVADADGNPFYLTATARLAAGMAADVPRLSLEARLRELEPEAFRTLATVTLAGRPLRREWLGPVGDLLRHELLVETSEGIAVRHALIGATTTELLDEDERRRLHGVISTLMTDPGEAARHAFAGDDTARAYELARAAAVAASSEYERAQHLVIAALSAPSSSAAVERVEAAAALLGVGLPHDVAQLLEPLIEESTGTGVDAEQRVVAEARGLLAEAAFALGEMGQAAHQVELALASHEVAGTDSEVRLRVLRSRVLRSGATDPEPAIDAAREALRLAERLDVDPQPTWLALGEALVYANQQEGLTHLRRVVDEPPDDDPATWFWAARALAHGLEVGQGRAAAAAVDRRALEAAQRLGARGWEIEFRFAQAQETLFARADYDTAIEQYEGLLSEPLGLVRVQVEAELAIAYADRGDFDRADLLLARCAARHHHRESLLVVHHAQAEVSWLAGRWRMATLAAARSMALELTDLPWSAVALTTGGWAALEAGEAPSHDGCAAIETMPGALAEIDALRLLASGAPADAAERFAAAAEAWNADFVRYAVRCQYGLGESLRRAGDVAAAECLEAVEARCERLGFMPLLGRVRQSLRALGIRRAPLSDGTYPAPLTDREFEVMGLVARGLTSRDIAAQLTITAATVESHVRSAITKLGARNRVEAVAKLRTLRDGG